jgi:hypothetical protein
VDEVVERLVRAEVGRLLHNEYPGKAICIDCLAAAIPAGSPPFTIVGLTAIFPLPPLQGGRGVPHLQHREIGIRGGGVL